MYDSQQQDNALPPIQPSSVKSGDNTRLITSQKSLLNYVGACLCFISELIHLWLLPVQYETYFVYGLIFLLIAMTQGLIGANLLFGPGRRLLTFGLFINMLIVVLYSFTHTIGVLVGLAFLPLPIDGRGITATVAELGAVIVFFLLQRATPRIRRNRPFTLIKRK
jgi:hypothetical protein